jgi:hypothetical protein
MEVEVGLCGHRLRESRRRAGYGFCETSEATLLVNNKQLIAIKIIYIVTKPTQYPIVLKTNFLL